jgi:hypothetical protein
MVKKININNATIKEIAGIQGVSLKLAERIIQGRPYSEIYDLYQIKGVGSKTFDYLFESAEIVDNEREFEEIPRENYVQRPDVVLLRFRAEDNGSVTLVAPNHGIEIPFSEPYLGQKQQILTQLEASVAPNQFDPQLQLEVGNALAKAIMQSGPSETPNLISAIQNAQASAAPYGIPWTLHLAFDEKATSSAQLPWELWHDGTGHPLADERLRINRYITYYGDRTPYTPVDNLKVLYVLSRPPSAGKVADLSGRYKKAVSRLGQRVQTDFIKKGTFEAFSNAITKNKYHIVHFDGHGWSDLATGEGSLLFEDHTEHGELVKSDRISEVLKNSGVRLVVLAACLGSTVNNSGMFLSTAPALIRAGVPAVVANQFSVWEDAMGNFSEEFYASIARGESISAAVADGRKAMASYRGQFFLPTLYMRVADGEGFLFSGEPELHRLWRNDQLAMLATWWWGMTELMRAHYLEGQPYWGAPNEQPPAQPKTKQPPTNIEESPQKKNQPNKKSRTGVYQLKNVTGIYEVFDVWKSPDIQHFNWPAGTPHQEFVASPRKIKVNDSGDKLTFLALPDSNTFELSGEGTFFNDSSMFEEENPNPPGSEAFNVWQREIDRRLGERNFNGTIRHGDHYQQESRGENWSSLNFQTNQSASIPRQGYDSWWDDKEQRLRAYFEHLSGEIKMLKDAASKGIPVAIQPIELMIPKAVDETPVIFFIGPRYVRISKSIA